MSVVDQDWWKCVKMNTCLNHCQIMCIFHKTKKKNIKCGCTVIHCIKTTNDIIGTV